MLVFVYTAHCLAGSSLLFIRVAIHNIELLYNAGAIVIRVAIHNVRKTD